MQMTRSYRAICFLVFSLLIMFFMFGCRFGSEDAGGISVDRIAVMTSLQKSVQDSDAFSVTLDAIDENMSVSRKKGRIDMKWKGFYDQLVSFGLEEQIECFVFKYAVYVAKEGVTNPQKESDYYQIPWRTEVVPSAKEFMTDFKLVKNRVYHFYIYARFKDHVGPNKYVPEEKRFCTLEKSDHFDPDNEYDKQLWYLGAKSATTLDFVGSGILGNYGYDMRKGGTDFNPSGLVNAGIIDMNLIFADAADAIESVPSPDTTVDHHEVTSSNIVEHAKKTAESTKWDLSWLTSGKGGDLGVNYLGDAISSIGATKGADGKVKNNSKAEGTANALTAILNSAVTSALGFFAGNSESSTSKSTKSIGKRVIGDMKITRIETREMINSKYWEVGKIKKFMNKYFLQDINDASMSPEAIFDKYGTHVPFEIYLGGKMIVQYSTDESNSSTIEDIKAAGKAFFEGDTSTTNNVTTYLDTKSKLDVHVWGGSGANSLVNKLSDYYKVSQSWLDSVKKKSNLVFVDAPGLLEGTGAGVMAPIWIYADEPSRQNELKLAFGRYVLESAYDVASMLYEQPRYLQDVIFFKLDSLPNSLSNATNRFNELLCEGEWKNDVFSKSVYKEGTGTELSDSFAFCKTFAYAGKPISFGKGVYGTSVYTFDKNLALRGIAVTSVDGMSDTMSKADVFRIHAQQLIDMYSLSNTTIDAANKRVGDWYMCDCDGYGSDVRIWKSKVETGKSGGVYPITGTNLCFPKGSKEEGWEEVTTNSGSGVTVGDVVLSVRREKVI